MGWHLAAAPLARETGLTWPTTPHTWDRLATPATIAAIAVPGYEPCPDQQGSSFATITDRRTAAQHQDNTFEMTPRAGASPQGRTDIEQTPTRSILVGPDEVDPCWPSASAWVSGAGTLERQR